MLKSTKQHSKYWKERQIDWREHYLSTWNHPHRALLAGILKPINWYSLWEVGCGPGANLMKIIKEFPQRQLGGNDINQDAIDLAKKTFIGGKFHCEPSDNLLLSDNSVDVILSDAHLIYYGPFKIKKVLREMARASRGWMVLCEYNERSFWKRLGIWWKTGYFAHNYEKLLEKMGWYGIRLIKIPYEFWADTMWSKVGYIIIAKKP